jgi:hypothetical protein
MCEDFAPNFGDKRTGCYITTTYSHTSFFTREFLSKNNMTAVPHPPYFSLFSRLKIKLKDRHFDTIEVTEAKSQAVMNTLTEHDFQDAFEERQRRWERCIHAEGDYLEGDGGQWAQSQFLTRWQNSPEFMHLSLYKFYTLKCGFLSVFCSAFQLREM